MEFRNPKYTALGSIDVEILTSIGGVEGWYPFTADPNDVEEHGRALYAEIVEAGGIAAYVPPTDDERRANMAPLSRRQFRLGMMALGITSSMIETAIASRPDATEREIAQINWEEASFFERLHPLVLSLASAFGIDAAALDDAWAHSLTL